MRDTIDVTNADTTLQREGADWQMGQQQQRILSLDSCKAKPTKQRRRASRQLRQHDTTFATDSSTKQR